MLLWLASYPRSGNTFLRVILNKIFDLPSVDIYGAKSEQAFINNGTMFQAMGGVTHEMAPEELISHAREDDYLSVVKTHERLKNDDPAIYIVRDGRSSIVSYYHYLMNVEGSINSLEDIIKGKVYAGSWSEHIYDWAPESRHRTLFIRFENLVTRPDLEIERIGQFLCLEPRSKTTMTFEMLHETFPQFFRSGSDEKNIRELEDSGHLDLFWRWHTPMMVRLGYAQ